ncbi:MAG: hypothetical protein MZV63_31905 [Marinilabiliales bacterium]|nr:hypothetical protein [Marinilabiliales bacterium]
MQKASSLSDIPWQLRPGQHQRPVHGHRRGRTPRQILPDVCGYRFGRCLENHQ